LAQASGAASARVLGGRWARVTARSSALGLGAGWAWRWEQASAAAKEAELVVPLAEPRVEPWARVWAAR